MSSMKDTEQTKNTRPKLKIDGKGFQETLDLMQEIDTVENLSQGVLQSLERGKVHIDVLFQEIKDTINKLIDDNLKTFLDLYDNRSTYHSFVEIENALENDCILISKEILKIASLGLSNAKESNLLKIYKQYYKNMGVQLRTSRKVLVSILTKSGFIDLKRYILRPNSKKDDGIAIKLNLRRTIAPVDDYIGISMHSFKVTPMAMTAIAYEGCREESFLAAQEVIEKIFHEKIAQETVRNITYTVGKFVYNNELKKIDNLRKIYNDNGLKPFTNDINYTLYIETDGAMIHLHDKESKIDASNNNSDKKSSAGWFENKLGLVFSSDNMVEKKRTKVDKLEIDLNNEDINDELNHNYHILKREYVSYIGSVNEFQHMLFYCALKNGYGKYKNTVLLSDGATWIKSMKDLYFPDAVHILDFYHLCEHLYLFAKKYFNEDETKYVPWTKNAKYMFKNGQESIILSEIEKMQIKLNDKDYKLYDYIKHNENSIHYQQYRDSGFFIGSGHIESGNKSVFQSRLKRPGMIWKKDIAQSILTLRAKYKSNLWTSDVEIPFYNYSYSNSKLFFDFGKNKGFI